MEARTGSAGMPLELEWTPKKEEQEPETGKLFFELIISNTMPIEETEEEILLDLRALNRVLGQKFIYSRLEDCLDIKPEYGEGALCENLSDLLTVHEMTKSAVEREERRACTA